MMRKLNNSLVCKYLYLFTNTFAFAQRSGQILLLLFVVVTKKFLPISRVRVLGFLFNDFGFLFLFVVALFGNIRSDFERGKVFVCPAFFLFNAFLGSVDQT